MASLASKYFWPLLGQEPMVTSMVEDRTLLPSHLLPTSLREELSIPFHLAPGIQLHDLSIVQEQELGFAQGGEILSIPTVSALSVSFACSPDLHIQRTATFRIRFGAEYPETPPTVHLIRDGQCNELLFDQYDDPRMDSETRGTLYTIRICDPDDGWLPATYTLECIIFSLRWTLTKIDSPSSLTKLVGAQHVGRLGTMFARASGGDELVDAATGRPLPFENGNLLTCCCLHHEEQGYRDSMEGCSWIR